MLKVDYENLFRMISEIPVAAKKALIQNFSETRFCKLLVAGFGFDKQNFAHLMVYSREILMAQDATQLQAMVLKLQEFLDYEIDLASIYQFNQVSVRHLKHKVLAMADESKSRVIVVTPRDFIEPCCFEESLSIQSCNPQYSVSITEISDSIFSISNLPDRYDQLWLEFSKSDMVAQFQLLEKANTVFKRVGVLLPRDVALEQYETYVMEKIFEGLFLQDGLVTNIFSYDEVQNLHTCLEYVQILDSLQKTKVLEIDCSEKCCYRFYHQQFCYWDIK